MNRKIFYRSVFLLVCLAAVLLNGHSQDLTKVKLGATYKKLSDGTKKIEITLQSKVDGKRIPVENENIQISSVTDASNIKLGTIITNYKGEGFLEINADKVLPKDKDGNFNFAVEYNGSKIYEKAVKTLQAKDVFIDIALSKDSSKTINSNVYEIDNKGSKIPVKDLEIGFFVSRLFCLYPIATSKTDQTGSCNAEFPSDMPGDSLGKVKIVVKIQDNETYATVENSQEINWGIHNVIVVKPKRGLGDTDAPLWMVYTLIVLLSAVWLHFLYVIFTIIRINRIGKRMLHD